MIATLNTLSSLEVHRVQRPVPRILSREDFLARALMGLRLVFESIAEDTIEFMVCLSLYHPNCHVQYTCCNMTANLLTQRPEDDEVRT